MKRSIIWDITRSLSPAFTLVYCLVYSSTLKMEATCSSETSADFQRSTRRYIPEDGTLRLISCIQYISLIRFMITNIKYKINST
jgi:hypothetical protein